MTTLNETFSPELTEVPSHSDTSAQVGTIQLDQEPIKFHPTISISLRPFILKSTWKSYPSANFPTVPGVSHRSRRAILRRSELPGRSFFFASLTSVRPGPAAFHYLSESATEPSAVRVCSTV